MRPFVLAAGLSLLVHGCATDEAGPALPAFSPECSRCHDQGALATSVPTASATPRDHLAAVGEGLVRDDPVFPTPEVHLVLNWPSRGRHDAAALADCRPCHPMRESDGQGHGVRVYPDPALAFRAGTDCASSCHEWIPPERQPGRLLAASTSAHGRLWRDGARPADPGRFRFGGFNAGCGGCHNAATEDHGAVVGCLECHAFGGPTAPAHAEHVADGATCDLCHAPEAGGTPASRAACHGCHPSGHDPTAARAGGG